MTPESLAALGARLLLSRRFPYFTPQSVAALKADDLIHEMTVAK